MNDTIGFTVVAIFVLGSTYGFIKQVQHTLTIQRDNKSNKRLLFGNYLTSISFLGFIISYILNVLVGMQVIQSNSITSNSTGFICFLFIAVLLISRYKITPKHY